MHKDGGILNCDAVQAGPTASTNRLTTEVGAEVGDNVGFVVGEAVGAGVGVVVGTGVGAVVGAAVGAVVGAGVGLWVTIPQIALLVGVASVCVYCSDAVHAAIAVHTVLDVVVAGSSMNSCSDDSGGAVCSKWLRALHTEVGEQTVLDVSVAGAVRYMYSPQLLAGGSTSYCCPALQSPVAKAPPDQAKVKSEIKIAPRIKHWFCTPQARADAGLPRFARQ